MQRSLSFAGGNRAVPGCPGWGQCPAGSLLRPDSPFHPWHWGGCSRCDGAQFAGTAKAFPCPAALIRERWRRYVSCGPGPPRPPVLPFGFWQPRPLHHPGGLLLLLAGQPTGPSLIWNDALPHLLRCWPGRCPCCWLAARPPRCNASRICALSAAGSPPISGVRACGQRRADTPGPMP